VGMLSRLGGGHLHIHTHIQRGITPHIHTHIHRGITPVGMLSRLGGGHLHIHTHKHRGITPDHKCIFVAFSGRKMYLVSTDLSRCYAMQIIKHKHILLHKRMTFFISDE